MLAENHTKNIWKRRVSERELAGIGSMLGCLNHVRHDREWGVEQRGVPIRLNTISCQEIRDSFEEGPRCGRGPVSVRVGGQNRGRLVQRVQTSFLTVLDLAHLGHFCTLSSGQRRVVH